MISLGLHHFVCKFCSQIEPVLDVERMEADFQINNMVQTSQPHLQRQHHTALVSVLFCLTHFLLLQNSVFVALSLKNLIVLLVSLAFWLYIIVLCILFAAIWPPSNQSLTSISGLLTRTCFGEKFFHNIVFLSPKC